MRTRAVALAFVACLLSSVGGRRVKDKTVDDAGVGTTDQIHSLAETEQSGTGQVNDAAAGTSEQTDSLAENEQSGTGQSNDAIGGTSDQAASLAESEQSVAKKPINPGALLLLALDPTTAFSSPTLPGRFGSLVKENAARMTTMQSSYGGYGMYGSSYDDSMYDDMMSRPALGFGGSTQDMINDNTWQRGSYYRYDDYGYAGTGSMYGQRGYGYGGYGGGYGGYRSGRRGYGNMYGRRGYGMRGYGYGGYGRYNDYGYGGYGSNYGGYGGYGSGYRRGYGGYGGY